MSCMDEEDVLFAIQHSGTTQWPEPTEPEPSVEQLQEWVFDGVCEATDFCQIEPDGVCEHGYPSWLLYLGLI